MSATIRSGASTGPGRLRMTAISRPSTSTNASATSISFTFSQKPFAIGSKLSSKPLAEKNESTTLSAPGDSAISPPMTAKKTTVLTAEMSVLRRREPRRAVSSVLVPAPWGSIGVPKPMPDM